MTKLMKTLLMAATLGAFAFAIAAPITVDLGTGAVKANAAFAKNGADDPAGDDRGGHGRGGDDGAGHQ